MNPKLLFLNQYNIMYCFCGINPHKYTEVDTRVSLQYLISSSVV